MEPMKVVIAGGSGALGRALVGALQRAGHEPHVLTRADSGRVAGAPAHTWDGRTAGAWAQVLSPDRRDQRVAVVNLAGKLVDCPPTDANIAALRDSRVEATRALVTASQEHPVDVWLQVSTTAIWSHGGDTRLTEDSPVPTGVDALPQMTGVAAPWEAAVEGAGLQAGGRLVTLRTSIVLQHDAPAFGRLVSLARTGAGGTVGSGAQWFSWIHVDDWLRIAFTALGLEPGPGLRFRPSSDRSGRNAGSRASAPDADSGPLTLPSGVVIAAAPNPVTNARLMRALRERRAPLRQVIPGGLGMPAPGPILSLGAAVLHTDPALGLTGRHTTSRVLDDLGFEFEHPDLDGALATLF
ncbi:NAD-dependent epimerase/dehydratase family protein [Brevibacterium litoralis]|uniref:NAD-dependent epimerase/dehydratase family protein n=1 Tax=Brevibacterium litoralis TaxID=3138935 RepID=UPI0032EE531D